MADMEDSFTQRILRRASQRRLRNSLTSLNSSKEALQRRHNILRAINDPSLRRGSCISMNDSQLSDQSYIFDITGLSCNNNNDETSTDAYKTPEKHGKKLNSTFTKFFDVDAIKTSGTVNSPAAGRPGRNWTPTNSRLLDDSSSVTLKTEEKLAQTTELKEESTKTSMLTSLIKNPATVTLEPTSRLNANTLTTKAVIEMCQKVYTALEFNSEASEDSEARQVPDVTSTMDSEVSEIYSNIYEDFDKARTEARTLEADGRTDRSSPRKSLFPLESAPQLVANEVTCTLDWKSEDPNKWEEIESTLYATSPYDEDKFLRMALGDELDKMSVTYDDSWTRDRTHSDFTASDLISEKGSPLQRKVLQALKLPPKQSVATKSSSTLNRSMKFYRSLSQRIKKKFRPIVKAKKPVEVVSKAPSVSEEIDMIQGLLQEVRIQQTLMNDTANALMLNDAKKEIMTTLERVEAERLLLLSSLRRKAALDEIKNITSDDLGKERGFREKAEVKVTGMSVELRDCLVRSRSQDGETLEWFVVAVIQGLKVWVSEAMSKPTDKSRIEFPGSVVLPELTPGFKIAVQVYSLRMKKCSLQDDKTRMTKQSRSTACLPYSNIFASPTKLLKKIETHVSPTNQDPNNAWRRRDSTFVMSGSTDLSIGDLSTFASFALMSVPNNSSLKGSIDLDLTCRLHLATSHQGFLNFYDEVSGLACWNRRWCVLKGHTLMFWNYPREQDIKEPLKIIELMRCVSNEITTVDRKICAKPRTLMIETERSRQSRDRDSVIIECAPTCTFVRNLLSFDSAQELNQWSDKLNHVLLALEEWQIIGQRTQPQVSDL